MRCETDIFRILLEMEKIFYIKNERPKCIVGKSQIFGASVTAEYLKS